MTAQCRHNARPPIVWKLRQSA